MKAAMSTRNHDHRNSEHRNTGHSGHYSCRGTFPGQYGDPLVMNTYLKVTILVLTAVCLALAALTYKSQNALANMHPMIVRINDVATPKRSTIATSSTDHRKRRTVLPHPLGGTFISVANRFTIERDQNRLLYFLNSDVQRA